jgi:hypothetical protein
MASDKSEGGAKMSAIKDVADFRLSDPEEVGDCYDDPAWRKLVGLPPLGSSREERNRDTEGQ